MNARLWPDKPKAVIVIEVDPEHLHEAIEALQGFLSAVRLNAPEDQELYGPTMHVAIEDVAQAVLKHFDSAPLIEDEDLRKRISNGDLDDLTGWEGK
jgi:hypothetical protein